MEIALKPFSTNSSFVICPSPSTSTAFLAKSKPLQSLFSSSHLISWKHSTKLSGSSGSPESWKRPITKSLRKFFYTIFLEYFSAKSADKENWNTGEDISSFLFDKSDYLSSSTSMEPPPSASKAVKIQLSWKKMKRLISFPENIFQRFLKRWLKITFSLGVPRLWTLVACTYL